MSTLIRESAAGQALLATLLFCFIFMALFVGLYKAGLSYIQKERALRGTDLTALSVGAVYANGLQLVRYSNVALMGSVIADVVTIVSTEGEIDPNLRGAVQTLQKRIFGINDKGDGPGIGLYPLLFWLEGPRTAGNNQLVDNWPSLSTGFKLPLPPLPMFFFNPETSDLSWLLVPNMSLRFRTAADLLPDLQKQKIFYYHQDPDHPGQNIYYPADAVGPAENVKNPAQMWVLVPGRFFHKYLSLKPVITPGAGASGDSFLGKSLNVASSLLKNIKFDVTHATDLHDHSIVVYDQLPSSINRGPGKGNLSFHSLSESKLIGGGLAAWDVIQPKFKVRLIPFEIQKLPAIRDWVSSIPGLPSAPAIPKIGDILQKAFRFPGFQPGSTPTSPSLPGLPGLNLPQNPGSSALPGTSDISPSLPSPADVAALFGMDGPSIP
ncbi:MAG TPA: hypothetical protein VHE12_07235 [bacterium]|nr:hypothetical protein [bacterium]